MVTRGRKTVAIIIVVFAILISLILIYIVVDRYPRSQASNSQQRKSWPKAPSQCQFSTPGNPPQCAGSMTARCTSCVKQVGTGANLNFEPCTCGSSSDCVCELYNSCVTATTQTCSS